MPETNPPVTATKARWAGAAGALICLVLFYAGPYIGLPVPEIEDVTDAFIRLGMAVATYLGTYGLTWISPANKPKGDAPMGGGLQAPWWTILGAATLALLLIGCAAVDQTARFAEERRAIHCSTFSPEQRAASRQQAVEMFGPDRAALLFRTCYPGEFGYSVELDGPR